MEGINSHKGKSFKYKGSLFLDGDEYDYCKNDGYAIIHDGFHGENTGFKGVQGDFAECVDYENDTDSWEGLEIPIYANLIALKQCNTWRKENKVFSEVRFVDDVSGVEFKFFNAKVSMDNGKQISPNQALTLYLKGEKSDYL